MNQVTIVGGGFGGVRTALELAKDKNMRITLISDREDFQYYPNLYNTATGHSARPSWIPLRQMFENMTNVTIIKDTINKIEPNTKRIYGSEGIYSYKTIIFALGSVTTYFGIEGLDNYSYGIKSEEEICALQQHIFDEMSDGSDDEKHYVIVGGGPTGVELAGALGEYIRNVRRRYNIRKQRVSINLIEAAPRVLPRMSAKSSLLVEKRLKRLGVHVQTNMKVSRQTAQSLIVNGKPLTTQTVIWTSGVANAPFFKNNPEVFTLNERRKVVVNQYMQAHPGVFVIGDNAATPYAGLAQTALHDAIYVAKQIRDKKHRKPYKAVMPASVLPVGKNWAVFEYGKLRLSGWPASLIRSSADFIGYNDLLPLGWAFESWVSMEKHQLAIDGVKQK